MLHLQPITLKEAYAFIASHHRHHRRPQGAKFAIAVNVDMEQIVGVIVIGRPVARNLDNGFTAEVTRCCTDGTKNAPSKLYAAAWRAARAMGYQRLITYTLATEPGSSLLAANWHCIGQTQGGSWSRANRPRIDTHPTGQKTLWQMQ